MKSHDLVKKAIEFRNPERIPLAKGDSADIGHVGFRPARDFAPTRAGMNEWGCVWRSINAAKGDQGQVAEHPLADWSNLGCYTFPDPFAPGRLDHAPEELEQLRCEGKFVCGSLGKGPMHLLDDVRGFEEYLTDLMVRPGRVELLLDGVFRFLSGMVRQFGDMGVDAVFLADDQAIQTGALFSMDIWRRRFKPRYRKLFDQAHDYGMKVYMHTCGDLSQHLAELVDAGVDIIDNKQPALWMDSAAVDGVRGRVTFSTCIDIQTTIHDVAEHEIEGEVTRLVRRLSVREGGFIGTYYGQPDLRIPPEKTHRMLAAFKAFRWDD